MSNPNDPLTLLEGTSASDQVRFNTAATVDGDIRVTHTAGTTAHTAGTLISVIAPTVVVPSTTFTATSAAMTGTLSVAGDTTMSNATASGVVTANTKFVSNLIEGIAPLVDTLVIKSKKVKLDADVEITGNLNTVSTQELLVKDKVIRVGAVDANEDGVDDIDDTTRDGAGLVVPGAPANLPVGKDAAKYEHHFLWKIKNGDFLGSGDAVAPHLKPMWEVAGGGLGITAPDFTDRMATFFFAPYFTATTASLGLYYSLVDGRVKLVHTFSTGVFGGPPVWVTASSLTGGTVGTQYTSSVVATGAVSYAVFSGALPGGVTLSAAGVLTGTPTAAGNFAFTVRATGTVPAVFADRAFTLAVV